MSLKAQNFSTVHTGVCVMYVFLQMGKYMSAHQTEAMIR